MKKKKENIIFKIIKKVRNRITRLKENMFTYTYTHTHKYNV